MDEAGFAASVGAIRLATWVYGVSFAIYVLKTFLDRKSLDPVATGSAALGWILHTSALALRWLEGGLGHPPWVTFYESLVFLSWAIVTANMYGEMRFELRRTGMLALALAFLGLIVANFQSGKGIEPIQPVLQSPLFFVHALFESFAYGMFGLAAFVAVFFLIKEKVRLETMMTAAAAISGTLCALSGLPRGRLILFTWAAFGVAAAGSMVLAALPDREGKFPAGWLGQAGELVSRPKKWVRWLFALGALGAGVLFLQLLWLRFTKPELSLEHHGVGFAAIALAAFLGLLTVGLIRGYAGLEKKLRPREHLDRAIYRSAVTGFALLTVSLVAGVAWTYVSQGRYWTWGKREIWLITVWLFYAMYLHLRVADEGGTRKSAAWAAAGFLLVLAAFLGARFAVLATPFHAVG